MLVWVSEWRCTRWAKKKSLVPAKYRLSNFHISHSYYHRMIHYWKLPLLLFYVVVAKVYCKKMKRANAVLSEVFQRSETYEFTLLETKRSETIVRSDVEGKIIVRLSIEIGYARVYTCMFVYIYIPGYDAGSLMREMTDSQDIDPLTHRDTSARGR